MIIFDVPESSQIEGFPLVDNGYHSRCHNCEMSFDNLCSAALRLNSLLGIRKRSSRKLGEKNHGVSNLLKRTKFLKLSFL